MSSTARRTPVWLAIVAASLPMFMATLDNLVMTTALPVLQVELSASLEQLQWMVNAYTLSFASLMIAAATPPVRPGSTAAMRSVMAMRSPATMVCQRAGPSPSRGGRRRTAATAKPTPPSRSK